MKKQKKTSHIAMPKNYSDCKGDYLERIRDRSRYACQGVLFVEIRMELKESK